MSIDAIMRTLAFTAIAGIIVTQTPRAQTNPYEAWSQAYRVALRITAQQVEAVLPAVPLFEWLQDVAGPAARVSTSGYVNCDPFVTRIDVGPPWTICVTARALLPDARAVHVAIVTTVDASTGESPEPTVTAVRFLRAYVLEKELVGRRALDVLALSELRDKLALSADAWPEADLVVAASDVKIEPTKSRPGEPVTITVTVRNIGSDNADALVYVSQSQGCSDLTGLLTSFRAQIPPGGSQTWRVPNVRGPNQWWLEVSVDVVRPSQYVFKKDRDPRNNRVHRFIGRGRPPKCMASVTTGPLSSPTVL